jgi:hypothetical protein
MAVQVTQQGSVDFKLFMCIPCSRVRVKVRVLRYPLLLILFVWGIGCDASLPEPESPAAQLYRQRCSGCHRVYAPGILTAEMWTFMVGRMEQQMQRSSLPPLRTEEKQTILEYLRKHSSKPS